MSTNRSALGGAGAFPPPITAMLSESSACNAPCEAPPTCALPPGTSNSQPGRADRRTAPPFAASRAPAIRSSAFGYPADSTRLSAISSRSAAASPRQLHPVPNASRARDGPSSPLQNSRRPRGLFTAYSVASPHREPRLPEDQIHTRVGERRARHAVEQHGAGLPQVNLCGAHVRTDHDLVARAPGLPEVRLPEVARSPVQRDDGGITIGEQLAVSVIRRHDHVCVLDEPLESASGVEHLAERLIHQVDDGQCRVRPRPRGCGSRCRQSTARVKAGSSSSAASSHSMAAVDASSIPKRCSNPPRSSTLRPRFVCGVTKSPRQRSDGPWTVSVSGTPGSSAINHGTFTLCGTSPR